MVDFCVFCFFARKHLKNNRFCEQNSHKDNFEVFFVENEAKSGKITLSTSKNLEKFADKKDKNEFKEILFTKPNNQPYFFGIRIFPYGLFDMRQKTTSKGTLLRH